MPNCCVIDAGDDEDDEKSFSTIVFARRDISAGDPITLPYVSLALGTYSRRLVLEDFGGCFCPRCMDQTELGLYVGNVCCEQCKGMKFEMSIAYTRRGERDVSFHCLLFILGSGDNRSKMVSVSPTDVLTANWICEQCQFTLSKLSMKELHQDIFDKLRALEGGPAELYQKFIDDNLSPSGILHPTHEAIFEAKKEIVLKDMELETSAYCSFVFNK